MEWMISAQARAMLEDAFARVRQPKWKAEWIAMLQAGRLVELEEVVQKMLGHSGAPIVELELQAIADSLDTDREPRVCPRCSKRADLKGRRARKLDSTIGELRYTRHVYSCLCGHTFGPADAAIGIKPGTRLSPRMAALTEEFGREAGSYFSARTLLSRTIASPSVSTIASVIARQGADAIARQREQIAAVRRAPREAPLVPDAATRDDTLIIECDGGTAPCRPRDGLPPTTRDDDAASATRAPRPRTQHREMKVGAIYLARDRVVPRDAPADRALRGRILRSWMHSWIGHWSDFGRLLWTLAITVGLRRAGRVVLIGDGAAWIDQLQREFFPRAIRILDFWHALEHVAAPGRLALGTGARFTAWLAEQRHRLRHGELDAVLAALTSLASTRAAGLRRSIRESVSYLSSRRAQLDYPRFVALGLPIGSGLIEGRIKQEKRRVDSSGMRWEVTNLQSLLTLRAHAHNRKATARRAA